MAHEKQENKIENLDQESAVNTTVGRRSFLQGVGTVIAGTILGTKAHAEAPAAPAAAAGRAPSVGHNFPDVTVVGAGAFGAWTSLCLRERGAKVTLLDSYGAGNARQASGDETRQIRCAYGDREIYSRWAYEAFTRWHERQDEFKRRLIFDNGVLSPNEPIEQYEAEKRIFTKLKIPFETLSAEECKKRWPQGGFEGDERALFEPKAGTVKARETLIAVAEMLVLKGGTYKVGMATLGASQGGKTTQLKLADGTTMESGMTIFACGPWLPTVLPNIMNNYIRRTRSEVFYVGSPAGDLSYHWERFPNMWHGGGGYSLSDVDYGYKVAPSGPGSLTIDPDTDERIVSPIMWEMARRFVAHRTPGLVNQPIVASRVCNLENSDNEHFIIDTHPEFSNVWIAGGGSGHGFKMGPKTGEYIADRVTGMADPAEEKALFALSAHKPFPSNPRRG